MDPRRNAVVQEASGQRAVAEPVWQDGQDFNEREVEGWAWGDEVFVVEFFVEESRSWVVGGFCGLWFGQCGDVAFCYAGESTGLVRGCAGLVVAS